MTDPYKVLGINQNATDEEVKAAYRSLAKKYHPDNYNNTPLAEFASEKMKEINEAYDAIINQRKGRKDYSSYYNTDRKSSGEYRDVRNLLMNGRLADAELILDGVPEFSRNAEWYFLKGSVLYRKGWLEEAFNNFRTACQMDPSNLEYKAAFNQVNRQRSGAFGGYNTAMPVGGGCSGCDICTSLVCADCCCECMGGDLIRCC